uniref:Putative secreted protein n=1 Tax=Rhipicephalus microplus TaxID=6941 RepID=A0A6M2DF28_RHIMP
MFCFFFFFFCFLCTTIYSYTSVVYFPWHARASAIERERYKHNSYFRLQWKNSRPVLIENIFSHPITDRRQG